MRNPRARATQGHAQRKGTRNARATATRNRKRNPGYLVRASWSPQGGEPCHRFRPAVVCFLDSVHRRTSGRRRRAVPDEPAPALPRLAPLLCIATPSVVKVMFLLAGRDDGPRGVVTRQDTRSDGGASFELVLLGQEQECRANDVRTVYEGAPRACIMHPLPVRPQRAAHASQRLPSEAFRGLKLALADAGPLGRR